jgi:hypothetical protein
LSTVGGKGINGTLPRYMVESEFDFESVNFGLHQEYIQLDCVLAIGEL